ncbi:hypothetical protein C4559_00035 [Candidatus Microgenomates bacterium]|nr:MAG: hypothetical protein C4559_00035 [Candidatus Microgenomates bacterium]
MKKEEAEKYHLLFEIVLHESKAMWDTSQLFLLSNTILATIIGANLLTKSKIESSHDRLIFWLLSLLGFFISILWWFSYNRTSQYYKFRMAQIRELEKKNKEGGLDIFAGKPEEVSNGNTVEVDGKKHGVRVLGWNFRSFKIVNIIIFLFIIFFGFIVIYFLPWGIAFQTK